MQKNSSALAFGRSRRSLKTAIEVTAREHVEGASWFPLHLAPVARSRRHL